MLVFCKSKAKNKEKDARVLAIFFFSVQFHQFTRLNYKAAREREVREKINNKAI